MSPDEVGANRDDWESRITSMVGPGVNSTFAYNGLDTRVTKNAQSFLRDGAYVTDPVLRDGNAAYTPGISERRGSATTFQHSGLKNADAQSGIAQTLTATKQYDAFGNLASSSGTWQGPFGYAGGFGYQSESDSGLMLLGHRYLDPSTGRFLTRDPVKDGRNWYGYVGNNPVRYADPLGLGRLGLFEFVVEGVVKAKYWIYDTWDEIVDLVDGKPTVEHGRGHGDPPGPGHIHIQKDPEGIHYTDRERADDAAQRGVPGWENWWDKLKEIVGWVDPTPVGLGIGLGEGAAKAIDPWAEEQKRKSKKKYEPYYAEPVDWQ